jgi:hypothetical protein
MSPRTAIALAASLNLPGSAAACASNNANNNNRPRLRVDD